MRVLLSSVEIRRSAAVPAEARENAMFSLKSPLVGDVVEWRMKDFIILLSERADLTPTEKRRLRNERLFIIRRETWRWSIPQLKDEIARIAEKKELLATAQRRQNN